jgi:translation initiation factor IF-3
MPTLLKDPAQISSNQVRIVLPEETIIITKEDAFTRAANEGMDLVLVQDGSIPVVKLVNYEKIEYSKQKQSKNHSKKAKTVKIGPHTQEYDMKRLAIQAMGFLKDGHPTTLRLDVHGRDRAFRDLIMKKIQDFAALVPCAKPGRVSVNDDGSAYTVSL